jgi:hypothetical protein
MHKEAFLMHTCIWLFYTISVCDRVEHNVTLGLSKKQQLAVDNLMEKQHFILRFLDLITAANDWRT